jgi:hypothetical protein
MKTKKTIHEVSNTINTDQLDVKNLHFFKIFSLPVWLAVVISISLGSVAKPVRSETTGTEDVQRNYRYIKPKGVENKAETASQGTKESASTKATEAKKINQGKQSATSGAGGTEKNANQPAKETSGAMGEMGEAKKTPPADTSGAGGTEKNANQPAKETSGAMGEMGEAKKTPPADTSGAGGTEKNANQPAKETFGAMGEMGEAKKTPPAEQAKSPSPVTTKETSAEKCPGAEKTTSGTQTTPSGGNLGPESKESSPATVKESGSQAPAPGNPSTNTGQSSQQMTPSATGTNTGNSTSGDKKPQIDRKMHPVSKAAEGEKAFPTFDKADKNGDHYVTKDEMQDYPSLLEVFDKVDAGKDGKLEQHEYQNLGMETKREGEIP